MTNQSATSLLAAATAAAVGSQTLHTLTYKPHQTDQYGIMRWPPLHHLLVPYTATLYCCIATTLLKPPLSLSSVTLNFFFYPWVLLFYTTSVIAKFMPSRVYIKSYFSDDSKGVYVFIIYTYRCCNADQFISQKHLVQRLYCIIKNSVWLVKRTSENVFYFNYTLKPIVHLVYYAIRNCPEYLLKIKWPNWDFLQYNI